MAKIMNLDGTQQLDLTRGTVEQAYDRWAPVYDLVFGGVFAKGRQAAIAATNKIGGRVLEVGVGTGISLPLYAPHLRIFGTDISEAMLDKARQRVTEGNLKNVEGLAVMDAEKLEFPDNSFDVVMAQYVVTAVPNPEVALDEFARVLRPGGELIILTPRQRRYRHAPLHRAEAPAGGASARLPHRRVRLVALCEVALRCQGHRARRAPPDSAARPFLAGALPQGRRRQGSLTVTPYGEEARKRRLEP
ncbi:SAM-dependent methyltransferase [Bradyrhizobium sp. S3.14.4]